MTDPVGGGASIEVEPVSAQQVFAGTRIELARRYVDSLAGDAVVRGLIGPRESGRLWTRHVLNSAVVGTLLSPGGTVVDIGSGAGLPGIPLAIARPDCSVVLVEPLERRILYLRQVVADLELTNCLVVRGRADEVIDDCGEADYVTSRAVAPLAKLAAWSSPLLRIGGHLLALKGSSAAEEIVRDLDEVAATGLVDLEVVSVGAGVVDPETLVIRGRRITLASGGKNSRAGNLSGSRSEPPYRRRRN